MPRIRSIKPEFFTDADLTELPPLHRLLYAGLWCHADREGKLEDKPRELKVLILPFDDANVDAMLWDLAEAEFIVRYVADGRRLIFIPRFPEHQHPHKDEKSRGFPNVAAGTVLTRGHHGASTAVAPVQHHLKTPDPCLLSLGSGSLIPQQGFEAVSSEVEPPATPPAPPAQPLEDRMNQVFVEELGHAYAQKWPKKARDALRELRGMGSEDEILDRLRRGLLLPKQTFGAVRSPMDLVTHWGRLAPPANGAGPPPRKIPDTPAGRRWGELLSELVSNGKPYIATNLRERFTPVREKAGVVVVEAPDQYAAAWFQDGPAELLRGRVELVVQGAPA